VSKVQLPYGTEDARVESSDYGGWRVDYEFTGKEEDPDVGLTYFRARFYGPGLGRWVSADPEYLHLGADAENTDELNLYVYVGGGPIARVDADGRWWRLVVLAVGIAFLSSHDERNPVSEAAVAAVVPTVALPSMVRLIAIAGTMVPLANHDSGNERESEAFLTVALGTTGNKTGLAKGVRPNPRVPTKAVSKVAPPRASPRVKQQKVASGYYRTGGNDVGQGGGGGNGGGGSAPKGTIPDSEIVVLGSNNKPGNFILRPGMDTLPIGTVTQPGKSASIATTLDIETEIPQIFGREARRGDTLSGAFVGDIRAAGFDVVHAPTKTNPNHVRIIPESHTFDETGREWLSVAMDRIARKR
jgi:RHS repeat-associated protein